jgi:hypothetical protein
MRPWTLAPCLAQLRAQLNAAYPDRSKASDGTIGDDAHAGTVSEHNPDRDARGTVRAFDITHDPVGGVDCYKLAAQLVTSRDSRILYVIWHGRIARAYSKPGIPAWSWARYYGPNPHTKHLHLSVTVAGANNTRPWRIVAPAPTQEDPLAEISIDDIEQAAARGVLSANLGSSGPTVAVALQRSYNALVALTATGRVDELADQIVAKLGGSADAATVKQAVKDALAEGIDS